MKSFKREFLEDHIPFGLDYSARETFYNQLEKKLNDAIEKDQPFLGKLVEALEATEVYWPTMFNPCVQLIKSALSEYNEWKNQ